MTIVSRASAKSYFVTQAKPTQAQFGDVIDSYLSLGDTASQTIQSPVVISGGLTVFGTTTLNGVTVSGSTTLNSPTINTPAVSGGTFSTPTINTPTVSAGTFAGGTFSSPTLTGTPVAPSAAKNTNTTQLATTAFVLNQAASAATMKAASTNTEFATPGTLQNHPGVAKAWAYIDVASSAIALQTTYNCSATYTNKGTITINFGTAFTSAKGFTWHGACDNNTDGLIVNQDTATAPTASSCQFIIQNRSGQKTDPTRFTATFFGTQ